MFLTTHFIYSAGRVVLKISQIWSKRLKKSFVATLLGKTNKYQPKSRQFNLLIISQFYPPDYAATGQLIAELAHHLAQKELQVNIFTGQPGYAFEQKQAPVIEKSHNLKIKRSRTTQFWSQRIRGKTLNGLIFTLRATLYIIRNARHYDTIIVTTAPPFLSVVGYLANLLFQSNYICLIYDLYPDAALELKVINDRSWLANLWHQLNALIWASSQKIVVLSETMQQRIVAQHPSLAAKITIAHNWADADWITPLAKQDNWFALHHQIDRQFTVLYSGNLGRCHDLETILGAVEILQNQPVRFVFIGAGVKYEICRQSVTDAGLDNCLFLPYQERANLPYSLTACDLALVSIAPGLEGVVAPSKVYGIMAAGKPIAAICEPCSYLRPLIADAGCGASFNNNCSQELANFIMTLAANPELGDKMGLAGRKHMQLNFTPQIIAQQYCDILDVKAPTLPATFDHQNQPVDRDSWMSNV